jgi:hypothetical protein
MAVLKLKSNLLYYLVTKDGYEDENGDFHQGESFWCEEPLSCDAVPSTGNANEITFEDGTVSKYSFTVYLNAGCREFEIGEKVRLDRYGFVGEYTVKGFYSYQHQSKLFI